MLANPSPKEDTRSKILAEAYTLFLQQGFHGTSMRQIAEAAGIALGAIYNHFPGKEALFKAVFLENHPYQEILPAVMAAQGEDPENLVREMAHHMVAALNRRPDFLNLLFIELVEFNSIHAVELYESILPQVSESLGSLMDAWQDRLRPYSPVVLARVFVGLFFSYFLTQQIIQPISRLPVHLQEHLHANAMDAFIEIFLHGVLKEEA